MAGPVYTPLTTDLKSRMISGELPGGSYLPSVRQLRKASGLAHQTVYRALQSLVAEGFVAGERGRGYRVLARANDPTKGCPVAHVVSAPLVTGEERTFYRALQAELQEAAARQGWSLLGIGTSGKDPDGIVEHCQASRAWGVVMDVHKPELVERAREAGLAVVMVNAWAESAGVDGVLQDGFSGARTAVRHLTEKGHERIAWFGPTGLTVHGRTRFGGAVSGLTECGLSLPKSLIADVPEGESLEAASKLLSSKKPPTAVLALWPRKCVEVIAAARELGIEPGKDLDVVGWCAEEFEADFLARCRTSRKPARITWSMSEMAETSIQRLAERRMYPNLPPVRISIETRLKTGR